MGKFNPKILKTLRKKKGLTQEEIAELIGIHPVSYARWESGYREPKSEYLIRLSKIFDVTPEIFFQEELSTFYMKKKCEEFFPFLKGKFPQNAKLFWVEVEKNLCDKIKKGDFLLLAETDIKTVKNNSNILVIHENRKTEVRKLYKENENLLLIPLCTSKEKEIISIKFDNLENTNKEMFLIVGAFQYINH